MEKREFSSGLEIDRIATQFEQDWQSGQAVNFARWLEQVPPSARDDLLEELLQLDVELRQKHLETIDPDQYSDLGRKAVEFVDHLVAATQLHATETTSNSSLVSNQIGEYEILAEIARGGMGVVYQARQIKLNRVVALKVIKSGHFASDEEIKRFLNEAEAAARLKHANIVPVYDVGQHESGHYLSMAFIDGLTLQQRLQQEPLDNSTASQMIKELADAVHYAHKQNIVHRDLKPQNVLLDRKAVPMITDFGLAKIMEQDSDLTHTGQVLGTPSYMAPEQARGDTRQTGRQTDVYALGGLLYAVLTGRPPFQAASVTETLRQVMEEDPVSPRRLNPAVDHDLETICLKCLEKDPQQRYESAREVANELERHQNGIPIQARRVGRASKAWRWCRRNPVTAAFAFLAVALMINLAILAPVYIWRYNRLAEKERTNREAAENALQEANIAREVAENQRAEADQRQKQMVLVNDSIQDSNSRIVKLKNYLELIAVESSFESFEFERMREYVKKMGESPVDMREKLNTFLHRFWRRVANPSMIYTNGPPNASSASISTNGSRFAIGRQDGTVEVHRNQDENRGLIFSKKVSRSSIVLMFWCDDESTLIAVDDTGKSYLVSKNAVRLILESTDRKDKLVCASLSPNGKLLGVVYASQPANMLLWSRDSSTSKIISLPNSVKDIQLGESTGQVLMLQQDGELRLFDFQNDKMVVKFDKPDETPWQRFRAAANLQLIVALNQQGEVSTYEKLSTVSRRLAIKQHGVSTFQVLDSERVALAYANGGIQVHNAATRTVEPPIAGYGYVRQLSASRRGQSFTALCSDVSTRRLIVGTLRALSPQTRIDLSGPERIEFRSLPGQPDRQQAVIRSGKDWWVIDLNSGQPNKSPAFESSKIGQVDFEGQVVKRYRVTRRDNVISVLDRDQNRKLELDEHSSPIEKITVSQTKSRLVSTDAKGNLIVWNLESGEALFKRSLTAIPIWIRLSPNGQFLGMITNEESRAQLFEIDDSGKLSEEPLKIYSRGRYITFSEDSKHLITLEEHRLKFCRIYGSMEMKEKLADVDAVAVEFMGGSLNIDAQWIARSGLYPTSIANSPDGQLIAIGTRNGKVQLWLVESGQRVATFQTGTNPVSQVRFSADNRILVAISRSGNQVFVWSTYNGTSNAP